MPQPTSPIIIYGNQQVVITENNGTPAKYAPPVVSDTHIEVFDVIIGSKGPLGSQGGVHIIENFQSSQITIDNQVEFIAIHVATAAQAASLNWAAIEAFFPPPSPSFFSPGVNVQVVTPADYRPVGWSPYTKFFGDSVSIAENLTQFGSNTADVKNEVADVDVTLSGTSQVDVHSYQHWLT
jgi:hypothetical protein